MMSSNKMLSKSVSCQILETRLHTKCIELVFTPSSVEPSSPHPRTWLHHKNRWTNHHVFLTREHFRISLHRKNVWTLLHPKFLQSFEICLLGTCQSSLSPASWNQSSQQEPLNPSSCQIYRNYQSVLTGKRSSSAQVIWTTMFFNSGSKRNCRFHSICVCLLCSIAFVVLATVSHHHWLIVWNCHICH